MDRKGEFGRRAISISLGLLGLAISTAACQTPPSTTATGAPANGVYAIGLTSPSVAALPACTTALSATTAYVQSPVGLWSCNGHTWVQIQCTNGHTGEVAYSSATQTLLACVSGQWTVIPLPQGDAGPQGPQGDPGPQGDAGAPGTLLRLSDAGASCPNGGQRIDVGPDRNGNGTLDDSEIEQTAYVCNGRDGANGAGGAAGMGGQSGGGGSGGTGGQIDAGTDGPDPLACVRTKLEATIARGTVDQTVASQCSADLPICCPDGRACIACGPIRVDFTSQPGDAPRLEITPVREGQDHVVMRARVKSLSAIPLSLPLPFPLSNAECDVVVDTAGGSDKDVEFDVTLNRTVGDGGVPLVEVGKLNVSHLTSEDLTVTGGIACDVADSILNVLSGYIAGWFSDLIQPDLLLCQSDATADGGAGDTPVSTPLICNGKCGVVRDGCGVSVDCGTSQCTGFNTCGGGGQPNVCGCTPIPDPCGALGLVCGSVSDGCGHPVLCGVCAGRCCADSCVCAACACP